MDEEKLFHEALACATPQERNRYLKEACAGRADLQMAVESLLAAHDQSGRLFCSPAVAGVMDGAGPDAGYIAPGPEQETGHLTGVTDPNSQRWNQGGHLAKVVFESVAVSADSDEIPGRIGRYQIRRMLGLGGMGTVYLAHDPELDRLVALKVPKLFGFDAEERFLREARAAAALNHPNLCPVYDAGRADGVLYLTMAYVPGLTLAELLRKDGPLAPGRAASLVAGVARGMAEAQRHGIVHRDLKPANILLDGRGEPVVTDFGLALRASASESAADPAATAAWDPRLTYAGAVMGTPSYMPPEQFCGNLDQVGPASDIYALGAILFELLTGHPPFQAASIGALIKKVETELAPLPSTERPGIPVELDAICRRALSKNPAERWPSMDAFAEALAPFAANGRRRPRGWVAVALAAAVPLLILAGVIFYIVTDKGAIEVRLSEPSAKVEVHVDGASVRLTEGGRVTTLRAGNHALEVKGEGFETQTRLFKVTRGDLVVVEVELKPTAKIAAAAAPNSDAAANSAKASRIRLAGLLARGQQLVTQSRFGELGPIEEEALQIDAESPGALALRATFRASRNDIQAAQADVELALKLNPETHRASMVRAHLYSEAGQYNEAIADFTVATRLQPVDAVAWANRASCYLRIGEYRQAIADSTRAIQLSFPREHPYLNRAAAYACLGEYDRAIDDYDAAAKIAGANAAVLVQRSAVHAKMGKADAALEDWRLAKKIDDSLRIEDRPAIPDPPQSQPRKELSAADTESLERTLKAAWDSWENHRDSDFRKATEEACKVDRTSPTARSLHALLLGQLERAEEALAEATEAILLDSEQAKPYTVRGLLRANQNDSAGAIADHTMAIQRQPGDHQAWNYRASAYLQRHDPHQALADLKESLRLSPNYLPALANRGTCHLELGEYEKALADYEALQKLQPAVAKWWMLGSAINSHLGNPTGALRDRKEANRLDPKLVSVPDMTLPLPRPTAKKDP